MPIIFHLYKLIQRKSIRDASHVSCRGTFIAALFTEVNVDNSQWCRNKTFILSHRML